MTSISGDTGVAGPFPRHFYGFSGGSWGGGRGGGEGGGRCKGKAAKPMRGYFAREEKILNISGVSYLLFFIVSPSNLVIKTLDREPYQIHLKYWIRIRIMDSLNTDPQHCL